MKRWSILFLITLFPALVQGAQRRVLAELFTSTTCGPCYSANTYLDSTFHYYAETTSLIRYHTWWPSPGNDPFYLANPSQNEARVNYYNIDAVPTIVVDGNVQSENYTRWRSILTNRASVYSPLEIELDMGTFGLARITLHAEEDFPTGTERIFLVIVEDSIHYNAPNGQRIFYQVMRKIFPSAQGKQVFIEAGETTNVEIPYYINPEWQIEHLRAVVFVQNEFSKVVFQSAVGELPPRPTYGYYLNCERRKAFVAPNDTSSFVFSIMNTGSSIDGYIIRTIERTGTGWDIRLTDNGGSELDSTITHELEPVFYVKFRAPARGGRGTIRISITPESDPSNSQELIFQSLSNDEILVVDDTPSGSDVITSLLDSMGEQYQLWQSYVDGEANPAGISYHAILWDCGESRNITLLPEQENYLRAHLNSRGSLLLAGSGIGAELGEDAFYRVFLGATFIGTHSGLVRIYGIEDDPLTDGLEFNFETRYAEYANPAPYNTAILRYADGECAGIRGGRNGFVYLPINLQDLAPTTARTELLNRIISWLLWYTDVEEASKKPEKFELTISPNPFNYATTITMLLPKDTKANLSVRNILGELIANLTDDNLTSGRHIRVWDAKNIPSGLYLITFEAENTRIIKKAILLK